MLRKIKMAIVALLAMGVMVPAVAFAESGHKFMPESLTPAMIADLVDESLQLDSSGNGKLIQIYCKHKASEEACKTPNLFPASPKIYLDMFVAIPKVNKGAPPPTANGKPLTSLSQLSTFLRKELHEVADVPKGKVWTACVKSGPDGDYGDPKCEPREIMDGEKVYGYTTVMKDTSTQSTDDESLETTHTRTVTTIAMAGNCKNPIFGLVATEVTGVTVTVTCITLDYNVLNAGSAIPVKVKVDKYGPTTIPSSAMCGGVKQPGDSDFKLALEHCEDNCFQEAEELAQTEGNIVINKTDESEYSVKATGQHKIRIPVVMKKGFGVSICVEVQEPDGRRRSLKGRHIWFHETDKGHEFDLGNFKDPENPF